MSKIMEANFKKGVQNHPHDLRDSVDALRSCVRDLYELDEENYQSIKSLRRVIEDHTKQIGNVKSSIVSIHAKRAGGAVIIGGTIWLIGKILKRQIREIDTLNKRIDKLEGKDTSEESDG